MIVVMGYLVITHVKTIDEARIFMNAIPNVGDPIASSRVVGVYRMPDRDESVCTGISGGCREQGWRRMRAGHMAHACGLRNRGYRAKISTAMMDWFGINLMPRERTPAVFRNPEGWDKK
jgi:hypothetical protein